MIGVELEVLDELVYVDQVEVTELAVVNAAVAAAVVEPSIDVVVVVAAVVE